MSTPAHGFRFQRLLLKLSGEALVGRNGYGIDVDVVLRLCRESLKPGGTLISHVLNGANPITGAEALAQNFDHYNTFTEYTLRQVLEHSHFAEVRVIPLHLYVFYTNPFNYVAWALASAMNAFFRAAFVLYGKSNKLFTKKIAAVAVKPAR